MLRLVILGMCILCGKCVSLGEESNRILLRDSREYWIEVTGNQCQLVRQDFQVTVTQDGAFKYESIKRMPMTQRTFAIKKTWDGVVDHIRLRQSSNHLAAVVRTKKDDRFQFEYVILRIPQKSAKQFVVSVAHSSRFHSTDKPLRLLSFDTSMDRNGFFIVLGNWSPVRGGLGVKEYLVFTIQDPELESKGTMSELKLVKIRPPRIPSKK